MTNTIFYVYKHVHPETKELVYIGKGCYGRAWDVTRARRENKEHQEWMVNLCNQGYVPSEWVYIIARFLKEEEALELEKYLIHENAPRFNMQSGEKQHQAKLTDVEAVQIYDLARSKKHKHKDIADTFGVSRTCVSMIASRKQWKAVLNKYRKEEDVKAG